MTRLERESWLRRMSVLGAAFAAAVGAVSLLGWVLDNDMLKGAFAEYITIKANTSICVLALGLALLLLLPPRRPPLVTVLGRALAVFAGAIGLATLGENLFGWDLGIDQLFFREPIGAYATESPNRMGLPASLCVPLLGLAIVLLDRGEPRGRAPFVLPAAAALVVAFVPMLGYLLGVREFYGLARFTGIALQTALALAALALAILCARPDRGFARRLVADDSGAIVIRRMLPAAILLPILTSRIRILGERAGLYHDDFGRVLSVLFFILIFAALTWWTGAVVRRQEAASAVAERRMMREADRRKNEFLATLAHELRNPLAPVRNAVQILRLKGASDPDVRWAQGMIDRQVTHLARLIDDLMDVSRIAYNKLELQKSRIALADVLRSAVESCQPGIEAGKHAFTLELPAEPVHLDADPVRLAQVFGNLLGNAIKYTPGGGRIALRAEVAGPDVIVRVTDSGIGITPEHRAHLFEMFFQANTDLARSQGGLGIGLALVRHLVALHGGSVTADSGGSDQGSEFVVRLPIAVDAAGATASLATSAPHELELRPWRVLVVDDNRDAAVSLRVLLERAGARVDLAHDGVEALDVAAATSPEIVILDLGLPRRDGYAVAKELRFRAGGRPILIALTGWGQQADQARSREAGFDHHLVKPVEPEALITLIAGLGAPPAGKPAALTGVPPV